MALDLDSTVYPLTEAIRRITGDDRFVMSNIHTYGALGVLCGTTQRMNELFAAAWAYDQQLTVGMMPGASDALQVLRRRGVEIHVMTARPRQVAADTLRFLQVAGVAPVSFACDVALDKVQLCVRKGIDVIVDDHPDTLTRAVDAGLRPVSLRWLYNADVIDARQIPHAEHWDQLLPLVLAQLELAARPVG